MSQEPKKRDIWNFLYFLLSLGLAVGLAVFLNNNTNEDIGTIFNYVGSVSISVMTFGIFTLLNKGR